MPLELGTVPIILDELDLFDEDEPIDYLAEVRRYAGSTFEPGGICACAYCRAARGDAETLYQIRRDETPLADAEPVPEPPLPQWCTELPTPVPMETFQALYSAARDSGEPVPFLRADLEAQGLSNSQRRMGLEIEMVEVNEDALCRDLYDREIGRHETVASYHDGRHYTGPRYRLEYDATVRAELITPAQTWTTEHWETLDEALGLAVDHGAAVSDKCGLHFHVSLPGGRAAEANTYTALGTLVAKFQDVLYRLGTKRVNHRGYSYARPITYSGDYDLSRYGFTDEFGHYGALNAACVEGEASDHIEFRFADGRVQESGEIEAIGKLCLALVRAAETYDRIALRSLPTCGMGWHYSHNPRERRLDGPEWEAQTLSFRQLLSLLFEDEADWAQMIALFAKTRWQTNGSARAIPGVKRSPVEEAALIERLEQARVIQAPFSEDTARAMRTLFRSHGSMGNVPSTATIMVDDSYRALVDAQGNVLACARIGVGLDGAHLSHLAYDSSLPLDDAVSRMIAEIVTPHLAQGRSLYATAAEGQGRDGEIVRACGFERLGAFHNDRTGHWVDMWALEPDQATELRPVPRHSYYANPWREPKTASSAHLIGVDSQTARGVAQLVRAAGRPLTSQDVRDHYDEWSAMATQEGLVLGAVRLQKESWWLQTISDLVVHPAWRSQGHGMQLLQHAMERARQSGARVVQVHLDQHNAMRRNLVRFNWVRVSTRSDGTETWMHCLSNGSFANEIMARNVTEPDPAMMYTVATNSTMYAGTYTITMEPQYGQYQQAMFIEDDISV